MSLLVGLVHALTDCMLVRWHVGL